MSRRPRPFILVLAGVNGAGKSSVGGHLLTEHGLAWFNPDSYARALLARRLMPLEDANAAAWHFGREQLEEAVAERKVGSCAPSTSSTLPSSRSIASRARANAASTSG